MIYNEIEAKEKIQEQLNLTYSPYTNTSFFKGMLAIVITVYGSDEAQIMADKAKEEYSRKYLKDCFYDCGRKVTPFDAQVGLNLKGKVAHLNCHFDFTDQHSK